MSSASHTTQLQGHQDSVLCLAHSSNSRASQQSLLLSGSEDGTARLWDLRSSPLRASQCIIPESSGDHRPQVISVAFGPPSATSKGQPKTTSQDYTVFLSTDQNQVLGYDLRQSQQALMMHREHFISLETPDEVNQIIVEQAAPPAAKGKGNSRKKKSQKPQPQYYLTFGDDSGHVHVTDRPWQKSTTGQDESESIETAKPHKSLQKQLEHGAMVTSIAIQPPSKDKASPLLLASGGTDCRVVLWNALTSQLLDQVLVPTTDTGTNQVCNPPFLHSLDFRQDLLVGGLGDGSLAVWGISNRKLVTLARVADAHSGSIASAIFCDWQNPGKYGKLVATAGNDGLVALWDLGAATGKPANPTLESLSLEDDYSPQTLWAIPHGRKPNWMVASGQNDAAMAKTLFIADTSKNITAYTVP